MIKPTPLPWLLVLIMLMSSTVAAQNGPIALEHIPEGLRLKVGGVSYMAYDLETFRLVAKVDASLTESLRVSELLTQELSLSQDLALVLEKQVVGLEGDLEACRNTVDKAPRIFMQPEPPEKDHWFLTWQHLLIESALVAVIGGLVYVSVATQP